MQSSRFLPVPEFSLFAFFCLALLVLVVRGAGLTVFVVLRGVGAFERAQLSVGTALRLVVILLAVSFCRSSSRSSLVFITEQGVWFS